ncbi:MAG TPA: ferredoxin [Spirochaetota bacterium]|nr:ferredoxin [Spirochaetota bacterium]
MKKYKVTSACDSCGLCLTAAPVNIRLARDTLKAYIHTQPGSEQQEKILIELMRACPCQAIIKVKSLDN